MPGTAEGETTFTQALRRPKDMAELLLSKGKVMIGLCRPDTVAAGDADVIRTGELLLSMAVTNKQNNINGSTM